MLGRGMLQKVRVSEKVKKKEERENSLLQQDKNEEYKMSLVEKRREEVCVKVVFENFNTELACLLASGYQTNPQEPILKAKRNKGHSLHVLNKLLEGTKRT